MDQIETTKLLRDLTPLTENDRNKLAGVALVMRRGGVKCVDVAHLLGVTAPTITRWTTTTRRERAEHYATKWVTNQGGDVTPNVYTGRGAKVYLSGAITGRDPEEVAVEFKQAAKRLVALGYTVVSPLNNGLPNDASWEAHMRADIALMMQCNVIYVCGDISKSKGAQIELDLARKLGYKVLSYRCSDEMLREVISQWRA